MVVVVVFGVAYLFDLLPEVTKAADLLGLDADYLVETLIKPKLKVKNALNSYIGTKISASTCTSISTCTVTSDGICTSIIVYMNILKFVINGVVAYAVCLPYVWRSGVVA